MVRSNPAYPLILPYLKRLPLKNRDDIYSLENYEQVLITAEEEAWNNILQASILEGTTKVASGSTAIDNLEAALFEGADFHDLIKQLG